MFQRKQYYASLEQADSFCNHITINVCLALASRCQLCYTKDRKGKAIEAALTL